MLISLKLGGFIEFCLSVLGQGLFTFPRQSASITQVTLKMSFRSLSRNCEISLTVG